MNWRIIKPIAKKLKSGRVRNSYLIECKCGYQRYVSVSEWNRIISGTWKSNISKGCRKCNIINTDEVERRSIAYTHLYNNLRSACKRVNRSFELTLEHAFDLYSSNCYYCNREPSNVYTHGGINKFKVYYNGIDRINNNLGYQKTNVVSCCFKCNRAKMNLDQKEFYTLISDIYRFRVQRLSETSE